MLIVNRNISYNTKRYIKFKYGKFKYVIKMFSSYRNSLNKEGKSIGDCNNLYNAIYSNEISLSTEIYGVTISRFISSGILLYKTAISKLCNFFLLRSSATLRIDPNESTFPISGNESK